MMMRVRWAVRGLLPVVFLSALALVADVGEGRAESPPPASARVVAKVGRDTITVGELERRMSALSPLQLREYGATPEEVKRAFLERVLIPELLFARGAMDRGLDRDPALRALFQDRLKRALLVQLREDNSKKSVVPPEEIAAYYEAHRDRYQSRALVSVWRILLADREDAALLLEELGRAPSASLFEALAKNRSLDKTTALSGGNLGFLTEDGVSSDGTTKVPVELVKAAMGVRDGELVREPVPEGAGFAVVWRRGSMPAMSRSLAEEAGNIEQLLRENRFREALDELVARLRRERVRMVVPNGTELLAVQGGGDLGQPDKPGRLVRRPGKMTPLPTPRGKR